jgi:hypothetical protein
MARCRAIRAVVRRGKVFRRDLTPRRAIASAMLNDGSRMIRCSSTVSYFIDALRGPTASTGKQRTVHPTSKRFA